jgi:hypothetical protein
MTSKNSSNSSLKYHRLTMQKLSYFQQSLRPIYFDHLHRHPQKMCPKSAIFVSFCVFGSISTNYCLLAGNCLPLIMLFVFFLKINYEQSSLDETALTNCPYRLSYPLYSPISAIIPTLQIPFFTPIWSQHLHPANWPYQLHLPFRK